jgi:hypothetical protein
MRQEQVLLPAVVHTYGQQSVEWKAPVYRALHHILTNPVYGGAYAFGRRSASVIGTVPSTWTIIGQATDL